MEAFPLLPEAGRPAGSGALHNMSAPPIMRIAIRPLEVPGAPRDAMETRLRVPGYHCLARVDLEALLREGFADAAVQDPRHRLAALILLARGEPAGPSALARLARRRHETLEDTLHEAAGRLDPHALGLPAFAVVRSAAGTTEGDGPSVGPVAAIALLTRTAGQVFVARRSPRLAGLAGAVPIHRYFVPALPGREGAP